MLCFDSAGKNRLQFALSHNIHQEVDTHVVAVLHWTTAVKTTYRRPSTGFADSCLLTGFQSTDWQPNLSVKKAYKCNPIKGLYQLAHGLILLKAVCFRLCVSVSLCGWVRSCVLIIDHVYEAQLRGRVCCGDILCNYSGEVALVASSRYTKNTIGVYDETCISLTEARRANFGKW